MTSIHPQNRSRAWLWALLAAVGVVYFLTLPENHTEAEDALFYLVRIGNDSLEDKFHPNHLFYGFANYGFLSLWRAFGYPGTALWPARVVNILASLAALGALAAIVRRLRFSRPVGFLAVAGTAFSFAYWRYSNEPETYVIPLAFVVLSIHRLLLIRADPWRVRNHVILGALHAAAVLFHQQHALLGGPVFVAYLWIGARETRGHWVRLGSRFLVYGLVLSVVVFSSYLAVGYGVKGYGTVPEILVWAKGHARGAPVERWAADTAIRAVIGVGRATIGAHFLFAVPGIADLIDGRMPMYLLREERLLVRDLRPAEARVLLVLSMGLGLAAVALIWQGLRGPPQVQRPPGGRNSRWREFLLTVGGAYLLLYGVFTVWWEPQNIEFWIALVPLAFILAASVIQPRARARSVGVLAVGIPVCLFVVNLFGSILPQGDPERDYWRRFNAWFADHAGATDLVVSGGGYLCDAYIEFYSGAKTMSTVSAGTVHLSPEGLRERLREAVAEHGPRRVLVSSTVEAPSEEILLRRRVEDASSADFFDELRPYLTLIHEGPAQSVFVLGPAAWAD